MASAGELAIKGTIMGDIVNNPENALGPHCRQQSVLSDDRFRPADPAAGSRVGQHRHNSPRTHAAPTGAARRFPHAHEVVSRRRKGEHPPNFEDSPDVSLFRIIAIVFNQPKLSSMRVHECH
jgi:hypothetical protein